MKKLLATMASMVMVGSLVFSVTVLAQVPPGQGTPDGMPPANEGVCDELHGATPGLYGLCVAYCEAQDLDGLDLSNPTTHNKNVPNQRILANYNKKMKAGDPEMPCIKPVCPCWDQAEIDQIHTRTGEYYDYDQCAEVTYRPYYEYTYIQEHGYDYSSGYYDLWFNHYAQVANYYPDGPYSELGRQCYYQDVEFNSTGYTRNIYRSLPLTAEEYAGCKQQILDRATVAQVSCQVYNY